ncbi:MAG: 3-dehydroquinate dehydratase [Chloroflexi bacterium]|nr:3-dehydroquinate dehydratase [Chloroflexota bacterium]
MEAPTYTATGRKFDVNILVASGPNLNLLGLREPSIYGTATLEQIHQRLHEEADVLGCTVTCFQSNHEGALIDFLQENRTSAAGALLNPGGLTHSSVSLHDTVKSMPFPVIEVHLSNIYAREEWRRHSVISPATRAQVVGFGWVSYLTALRGLVALLRNEEPVSS